MAAPFEVMASPFDAYVAPLATAFPTLDQAPAGTWKLIGTTVGARNQTDTGVTVTNSQTVGEFTPGGSTVVRKRWRQAEGLTVALAIADLSVTQYANAVDAAVNTVAPGVGIGNPGYSSFEMFRGTGVAAYALLVRGISPFNDAFVAQYEVPSVHQMGSPAPNFSKQNPAELALEWHAYELTPGNLCVFRAQSAVHT